MNELLHKHKITVDYIEAITGQPIDIDEVVELGLEALKAKADKQRDLQRFTRAMSKPSTATKPASRSYAIQAVISQVSNWEQLQAEVLQSFGIDICNVKPANAPAISNHPYYYEDALVFGVTGGKYSINKRGSIVKT